MKNAITKGFYAACAAVFLAGAGRKNEGFLIFSAFC